MYELFLNGSAGMLDLYANDAASLRKTIERAGFAERASESQLQS